MALLTALLLANGTSGAAPSAGAPRFNTPQVSEQIRGAGANTTFFVMQKIGDLYDQAGLFGCQLVASAGQNVFGGGTSVTGDINGKCQNGASDISTTDDTDNWNRVEVSQGVNVASTGAGENQLCGVANTPDPVNFARSSKPPANISGCNELQLGYAKDGVPIVDFPTINPSTIGTSTFGSGSIATGAYPNGAYNTINGGVVGPVAAGWLPGDNPSGAANHGTKLVNITNTGALDSSVAFRLWCTPHVSGTPIGDWGALTNLGPNLEVNVDTTNGSNLVNIDPTSGTAFSGTIATGNAVTDPFATLGTTPFASGTAVSTNGGSTLTLSNNAAATGTFTLTFATGAAKLAVGSGVPIGIPIRIVGTTTNSGTNATFANFADGQTRDTTSGCTSSSTLGDANSANDPNSATAPSGNPAHIVLENNAHQLEVFSQADFPSDPVDQAIEEATSLYYMSNGVYNTNAYVGQTTVNGVNYAANLVGENGTFSGAATELNNTYPTARTLSNIVNSATVTESTAGFLNWICDSNTDFTKGMDLNTGLSYDAELSNIISTNFGFPRLSDTSQPISAVPADNTVAPNDTCAAQIPVTANGSNTVSYAGSGSNFPNSIIDGGTVVGTGLPTGTTVTSTGGSSTLTLSNPLSTSETLEFFGVPAVITSSATP